MDYREIEPSAALRAVIRCYWTLSGDAEHADGTAEPALPDGSPELILNFADPFVAHLADGATIVQPLLMLVGQITGPFHVAPSGRIELIAVRFQPHGASLLCDDLASITDTWLDADALNDAALVRLHAALSTEPSLDQRVALLEPYLLALVARRAAADARVSGAVRAIRDSNGAVALDDLCRSLGATPRTLQRLFASQVGLSPKMLARITRFQRVFSSWRHEPSSLARVAAECGYFDQSHLVRDFRDFAGAAPAAFLASQPEFTAFFTSGG